MVHTLWQYKWRVLAAIGLTTLFVGYVALPVYRAQRVAHPARKALAHTPADFGLKAEDVSFQTAGGQTVRGWLFPGRRPETVIVTHGYTGNRADELDVAKVLSDKGFGALLLDLQDHGESDGPALALDGREVMAAERYLHSRPDHRADSVGVWGFSLGGLEALQAAARDTAIKAVVADGPFPVVAAEDMPAPERLDDWLWLPFDAVQRLALRLQGVAPAMSTTDALRQIAARPVLLIAGLKNRGERRVLRHYASVAGPGTSLWEVPEAGHTGSWTARHDEYVQRALGLLGTALGGST